MSNSTVSSNSKIINQSSTLSKAIKALLPELMNRNTKLGKRLKSKLKVSSLLNNIELRNQYYLKELVSSSEKTVQDLKSGLDLPKAMKSSSDRLVPLNSKILNDCFMKKNNVIFNTKKALNRSTEEETNLIIKRSLSILRDCLNPTYKVLETQKTEEKKKNFLSQAELSNAEMIIKNKIFNEEKLLKEKIKNYLEKVKNIKMSNIKNNSDPYDYKIQKLNKDKNRDFYFYAKHLYFDDNNIKMIHYKKVEPPPVRDKPCPNLESIKEKMFPNIKNGEINSKNYININNSNGIKIIKSMKLFGKFGKKKKNEKKEENKNQINRSDIMINNNKDSFNILKKIIIRNRSLVNKSASEYNKLSHLIDINLPKLSDYEKIIDIENKKIEEEKNKTIESEKNKEKNKNEMYNKFSNLELIKELRTLKGEINFLKEKKLDIDENYLKHQEELANVVYVFDKKPVVNKMNNVKEDDGLINRKIIAENPKMRLPSSHSVSILKRKFKINSGISHKYNRSNRNYSNYSMGKDRTSASTIKNSASYIITSSKSNDKYNEIFNKYLKKEIRNKSSITKRFDENKNTKNYNNSSNITSLSDL